MNKIKKLGCRCRKRLSKKIGIIFFTDNVLAKL